MLRTLMFLAQDEFQDFQDFDDLQDLGEPSAGVTAALVIISLVTLAIAVVVIVAMWKIFTKAGQPGWASLIPIYNTYVLLKIVGRPGWWLFLYLIPVVNIVIGIIVSIDLATSFGKSGGFAVGLIFLPFVFYPILGFGRDTYLRPAALT